MLGVELSGPILSELSRTSGHTVRYPSFYLKVDLNMKKITSRTLTISFFKAKMELKEVRGMFSDLKLPKDSEFLALEELTAALRPLEALTTNLCRDHFTARQAETVFQTAFAILRSQQTTIGDKLLAALERRYKQRKNVELLSVLTFLRGYEPGSKH
jgi:hypothetical protein